MNRNEEEKSRNNRTINKYLTQFFVPNGNRFSLGRLTSVVSSPSRQTVVNKKEGQKRCQRKHIKNTTINQILPFVVQNLGPVARNGDGGETTDDRQRETKRRGRKHEDPAELTIPLFIAVVMFCCCCVICEVDRVGRYYGFQNIKFPGLDLH